MLIVSAEGGHTPLDIVHAKRLVVKANPFTLLTLFVGETIVPVPAISVQRPLPTLGALAISVEVEVKHKL